MKEFTRLLKACPNKSALARKADVHINTINGWVYGNVQPTLENAERVLNALGYRLTIEKLKEGKKNDIHSRDDL